jgi:hypothetical protein
VTVAVNDHSNGMSDDAMRTATGRAPEAWFTILDSHDATTWTHTAIARWLFDTFDALDGWWSQAVTVRYEQSRGMRQPGQQADGTYSVSATKTIPLDSHEALDAAIGIVSAHLGAAPDSDNRSARYITARWKLAGRESMLASAAPDTDGRTPLTLTHSRIDDPAMVGGAKDTLAGLLSKLAESLH